MEDNENKKWVLGEGRSVECQHILEIQPYCKSQVNCTYDITGCSGCEYTLNLRKKENEGKSEIHTLVKHPTDGIIIDSSNNINGVFLNKNRLSEHNMELELQVTCGSYCPICDSIDSSRKTDIKDRLKTLLTDLKLIRKELNETDGEVPKNLQSASMEITQAIMRLNLQITKEDQNG